LLILIILKKVKKMIYKIKILNYNMLHIIKNLGMNIDEISKKYIIDYNIWFRKFFNTKTQGKIDKIEQLKLYEQKNIKIKDSFIIDNFYLLPKAYLCASYKNIDSLLETIEFLNIVENDVTLLTYLADNPYLSQSNKIFINNKKEEIMNKFNLPDYWKYEPNPNPPYPMGLGTGGPTVGIWGTTCGTIPYGHAGGFWLTGNGADPNWYDLTAPPLSAMPIRCYSYKI